MSTRCARPRARQAPEIAAALTVGLLASCSAPPPPASPPGYAAEIENWRASRDERLRSETGWLTLVGLYWLEPGENGFGSAPDNAIVLPRGPAVAGSFYLADGRVTVRAQPGAGLALDDQPVTERALAADDSGEPDILMLDDLRLYVIKRADRYAIRVKDPRSPVRENFKGLEYFPIDPAYHVVAKFVPFDRPEEVEIATVLGTTETMLAPGYAEFTLQGKKLSLEPLLETPDDEQYFFIFRDETSGKETYGAGRYLYADAPQDDRIVLDFNKAYNPPCCFTPYATCPLPPKRNRLPIRIEAGEKVYGHQGAEPG